MVSIKHQFNHVYHGKRVLVTGHTGFKGSWLSLWLSELGAEVYGYALDAPTAPSLFDEADVAAVLAGHEIGDVRDREKLKAYVEKVQPQIMFHLAAHPLVRLSYDEPAETYETNVMGTVNLLEAVRTCDCVRAIVNVTTD
jgi:CDP-glucose 4,6-dehydratase